MWFVQRGFVLTDSLPLISPKPQPGTKRQIAAVQDVKPEVKEVKEPEVVEPKRAKLTRKESPTKPASVRAEKGTTHLEELCVRAAVYSLKRN